MSAAPSLADTLSRGYTAAETKKARERYRMWLIIVLVVEALVGLGLLLMPAWTARLLAGGIVGWPFVRPAGLLLLIVVALLLLGRPHPERTKATSLIGIAGRAALALLLLLAGSHRLMIAGIFEGLAAVALGWLYYAYFKAEVMSRP